MPTRCNTCVKHSMHRRNKFAVAMAMAGLSLSIVSAVPASATSAPVGVAGALATDRSPEPGSKARSPRTNLSAYPKLTKEQLAQKVAAENKERAERPPVTGHSPDVISRETLADGRLREEIYTPAPGVTPEQLADMLRKQGKQHVEVARHDEPSQSQSDIGAAGADDCAYGWARTITCPVSYWDNLNRPDPLVVISDYSGLAWPTDNAVYKWNAVPNIEVWYQYQAWCDPYGDRHCVDVYSGNYGATGWLGRATRYYIPPNYGSFLSAKVDLNEYYPLTNTTHNHVVTHELGHVLGLGHNTWSGDVMYPSGSSREDIGGENAVLLASLYSVYRS
jgi:Matrixin